MCHHVAFGDGYCTTSLGSIANQKTVSCMKLAYPPVQISVGVSLKKSNVVLIHILNQSL